MILKVVKPYGLAVRSIISLLAIFSVHLFFICHSLLGPLADLADPAFFFDLTADLLVFVALSSFFARLAVLLLFTSFTTDLIRVGGRIAAWIVQRIQRSTDIDGVDFEERFVQWLKVRGDLLEVLFSVFVFLFFYAGSFFTIRSSIVFVLLGLTWLVLVSGIWYRFDIMGLTEISAKEVLAEPKKAGIVFATLSVSLLGVSVLSAFARAREIQGTNIVAIRLSRDSVYSCVSLLGKTSTGVFAAPYFTDPEIGNDGPSFYPFEAIVDIVAVGGAGIMERARPEQVACGKVS